MPKYSQYIELRPGFESVVDLASEERNPNLWQEYIVHDDMKLAVEKICDSFKNEDKNQRRSFWIHGTYGTGKSYAAIVLKHLFTDSVGNIEDFFDRKRLLLPYKNKFLSIRRKGSGDFLVIWKSGCSDIVNGTHLMMEMEISIRDALKEKFGDNAYYGRASLIEEVKRVISDNLYNWNAIFEDPAFGLKRDYADVEEFKEEVLSGSKDACNLVARICRDKGLALFSSVENFKEWIADIISGNGLADKGIVFIWDEFTDFVKNSGDDNILQQLSEYCKKQPFFMFLIVHVDTSWVSTLGEDTYNRIMHRYHELEFRISETAAHEMIAESITCRNGMNDNWNAICNDLVRDITPHFDEVSCGLKRDQLINLCPIHPMTLTMLTKVSGNFAAASRTLFSFMKDQKKADKNVGFVHFINTCGPDEWAWLTIDYLWDYFFTTESDIRQFSQEARRAFQLFEQKKHLVESADPYVLRVLKGALLLIAIMSTDKTSFTSYTRGRTGRVDATRNTLRRCFAGTLTERYVDECLKSFHDSEILLLAETSSGKDARIELPYGKNVEKFDVRLDKTKKDFTRYMLFKKGGEFAKSFEDKIWSKTDATFGRMVVAACSEETNSISQRFTEVQQELSKCPYKIGLLTVIISDSSKFVPAQTKIKEYIKQDATGRIVFAVAKNALTAETLEAWYRAKTNYDLAKEDGKDASTQKYELEMGTIIESWSGAAADDQLAVFYGEKVYPAVYGSGDLMRRVKTDVIFSVFPAAPEQIVKTSTVYKKAQDSAAKAGIVLESNNNQIKNIETGMRSAKVWDIDSIDALEVVSATPGAKAVAELAKYIRSKMTQGAKISLSDLWHSLQMPPFGYYNNMACAYLLGYVFRFWKNSDFNWVGNDSVPHPLTEATLATMIISMCQEKTVNHTLTSGSEIWQKFKPFLQKVFGLNDTDVPNEERARHSLSAKIISSGTPIWALKYVDASAIGGTDAKKTSDAILDAFSLFLQKREGDNQEDIMSTVINLFTGKGKVRKALEDCFKNSSLRYAAFKRFIAQNSEEMQSLIDSLHITDSDVFDDIKKLMQGSIDTWTEAQVIDKLVDLAIEYKVVNELNVALGSAEKSIAKHVKTLKNCFSLMKVPGRVIETLNLPWFSALEEMYKLTNTPWQNYSVAEKNAVVEILHAYGKEAWQNVCSSRVLLEKYIAQKGISYTEDDLSRVYREAREWEYNTSVPAFEAVIDRSLAAIKHEYQKGILLGRWHEISGYKTVAEWCQHYMTPIQWVVPEEAIKHIQCVIDINNKKSVGELDLYNAIQYLNQEDLSCLTNYDCIENRFFDQIGQKYRCAFAEHRNDLLTKIRLSCGSNVLSWATQGGKIVRIIDEYLKKVNEAKVKSGAKDRVKQFSKDELCTRVLNAMEKYPELYQFFVD